MLWAFSCSTVQCVEVCQRDLPRRGVRSVLTFPLARTGLGLFRHESLLELSGAFTDLCTEPRGCSRGWPPASRPWWACCVLFTWSDSPEEKEVLSLCASVTSCRTVLCAHVFQQAWNKAGRDMGVFAESFSCSFLLLSDWNCFPATGGFGFSEVAQQWITVSEPCRQHWCDQCWVFHQTAQVGNGQDSGASSLRCTIQDVTYGEKCHVCLVDCCCFLVWQHPAYCFAIPNSGQRLCSQLLNKEIILKEPVL